MHAGVAWRQMTLSANSFMRRGEEHRTPDRVKPNSPVSLPRARDAARRPRAGQNLSTRGEQAMLARTMRQKHAARGGQLRGDQGSAGRSADRTALLVRCVLVRCIVLLVVVALAPGGGRAAGAAAAAAAADSAGGTPQPRTVEHVDLERYVGRWYEISRIPNWFQASCARGTTATYTLGADGRIAVVNRCLRADGSENEARGVARVVDPATNARLEVSFVRFLGKSFFWGDYWVIGLGADYEYALVGTPDRKFGWVLARTPTLGPDVMATINAELRAQGYDPERFAPSAP